VSCTKASLLALTSALRYATCAPQPPAPTPSILWHHASGGSGPAKEVAACSLTTCMKAMQQHAMSGFLSPSVGACDNESQAEMGLAGLLTPAALVTSSHLPPVCSVQYASLLNTFASFAAAPLIISYSSASPIARVAGNFSQGHIHCHTTNSWLSVGTNPPSVATARRIH
jgi:hypothetical protein